MPFDTGIVEWYFCIGKRAMSSCCPVTEATHVQDHEIGELGSRIESHFLSDNNWAATGEILLHSFVRYK